MEWKVGKRVAVYGPYAQETEEVAIIEKVYKGGNVVVKGRRYKPGFGDFAFSTGDSRFKRHKIRLLTPDVQNEVNRVKKRRRQRVLATWLIDADPDAVPDDLLRSLLDAHNAAKTTT